LPRRLDRRVVGVRRHPDRLADRDGEAAERQVDARAVPIVELDPAARRHRDRVDRPPRGARKLHDPASGDSRYFGHVRSQRHVVALLKGGQHLLERGGASLALIDLGRIAPMASRPANGLDAEPRGGNGIDRAVAVTGNQGLDPVLLALEERHHEMLPVPHRHDEWSLGSRLLIKIRRLDRESVGPPDEAQIFGRDHANRPLHPWRAADPPE